MFENVDRYVHVLSEMKISANQFLLCYLLYTDQKKDGKYVKTGKGISNLYKYVRKAVPWTKEEVRDLVDKGYLRDPDYKSDDTYPDHLLVTDKFVDKLFVYPSAFEELWEEYPTIVPNFKNPNGPSVKLKSCDYFELQELYKKLVRTKYKHKEIIELVKWARDKERLNIGIEKFVKGRQWEALKEDKANYRENNSHMDIVE